MNIQINETNNYWAVFIDIEGYSNMFKNDPIKAMQCTKKLIENSYIICNNYYNIFGYQNGLLFNQYGSDGFLFFQRFLQNDDLNVPVSISIALLKSLLFSGCVGRAQMSTGRMASLDPNSDYFIKNNIQIEGNVETLEPIRRPLTIIFVFVWDCLVIYNIFKSQTFDSTTWLFIIVGLLVSIIILKQTLSQLNICITNDKLIVKESIFSITYKNKSYNIREINDLQKVYNANERTYWGSNGFGLYDKTPVILSFKYNKKHVSLGLSYNWQNIDEAFTEIKKRIINYA